MSGVDPVGVIGCAVVMGFLGWAFWKVFLS